MTSSCLVSAFARDRNGLSLVELLVVIAVIAIVAAIALPNISNARASAQQSAIDLQEKNLNSLYKSVKAASTNMPSTGDEILAYLAGTNTPVNITPPETMEGPEGTLTLSYDAGTDLFAYTISGGGRVEEEGSAWNPPADTFVSNNTTASGPNGGGEAWFDFASNPGTPAGGEDYYTPQAGGFQFEAFRINASADGSTATLTTQSGQIYDMDLSNPSVHPFIQNGDQQIHWGIRNGGISVSSVVHAPQ